MKAIHIYIARDQHIAGMSEVGEGEYIARFSPRYLGPMFQLEPAPPLHPPKKESDIPTSLIISLPHL